MSTEISEALAQIRASNIETLTPSDCARRMHSLIYALRDSSFYSKRHRPLSSMRLQQAIDKLKAQPELQLKLQGILFKILSSFDFLSLLTQTGLSRPHGFMHELASRCMDKVLPRHTSRPNFKALLFFLFPSASDARFFMSMPPYLMTEVMKIFDPKLKDSTAGRAHLAHTFYEQVLDSLLVLGAEALVLTERSDLSDIRWRIRDQDKKSSPFLRLNHFINKMIRMLRIEHEPIDSVALAKLEVEFEGWLRACREDLKQILAHLEQSSLSVDLVYHLEVSQLLVERIQALFYLVIFPRTEIESSRAVEFFASLIEEEQRRRSVRTLVSQNLHYLARKIVDRAGETGEHYIARTPAETLDLFKAALGGGFLTAFTSLFKLLIHHLNLAMFFEGVSNTINYAGGFIIMQFFHLTLATKQPAMTAAALARKMTGKTADLSELRLEMKRLLKSQTLAALGNLCAVIPTSYLLFLVGQALLARSYMSHDEAIKLIHAHNPLQSLTLFYAFLTGVLLWSTSVVHGWVENWMVFRGISELLSESFVVENFLSRDRRIKLSKWLDRNLAGIVTNISLGFLLAFVPILGSFFGLPLEVRHITLATGGLTLAYSTLPAAEITSGMIAGSVSGLVIILFGNLVTSFILSMWLALRARGWRWHDVKNTLRE